MSALKQALDKCGEAHEAIMGLSIWIQAAILEAVEAEREECAKLADGHRVKIQDHYEHYEDRCADLSSDATARSIAGEIRARADKA